MLSEYVLVSGLVSHFIADFVLQSDDMAIRKSKEPMVLLNHCLIHFALFSVVLGLMTHPLLGLIAAGIISLTHALIDWNVWRGYKYLVSRRYPTLSNPLEDPDVRHLFFLTVGFDQMLHMVCLVFSLWMIS